MQRFLPAVLSIFALTVAPACKDDKGGAEKGDGIQPEKAPSGDVSAGPGEHEEPKTATSAGQPATEPQSASTGAPVGGPEPAAEGGAAQPPEPVAVDPAPLLEQAKSLDTEDEAAKKLLDDAIAAGAAKMDAAKAANARGEKLMADGEAERATAFFQWAADTHTLFSEPVYNLATLAAYAGDLDIAKEHLAELQKRGNKKLMKKVGVDPAFAPLQDDPEVRKIYEQ